MTGPGPLATAVSWLFVPASRPDRFAKAARSGADVVVIDLEDAVAADGKAEARAGLARHWPGEAQVPVVVRVNGIRTAESADDLATCRALARPRWCCPRPRAPRTCGWPPGRVAPRCSR